MRRFIVTMEVPVIAISEEAALESVQEEIIGWSAINAEFSVNPASPENGDCEECGNILASVCNGMQCRCHAHWCSLYYNPEEENG